MKYVVLSLAVIAATSAWAGDKGGNGGDPVETLYYRAKQRAFEIVTLVSLDQLDVLELSKDSKDWLKAGHSASNLDKLKDKFKNLSLEFKEGVCRADDGELRPACFDGSSSSAPKLIISRKLNRNTAFEQAVATVFHEVGHLAGEMNHLFLSDLGAQLASLKFASYTGNVPIKQIYIAISPSLDGSPHYFVMDYANSETNTVYGYHAGPGAPFKGEWAGGAWKCSSSDFQDCVATLKNTYGGAMRERFSLKKNSDQLVVTREGWNHEVSVADIETLAPEVFHTPEVFSRLNYLEAKEAMLKIKFYDLPTKQHYFDVNRHDNGFEVQYVDFENQVIYGREFYQSDNGKFPDLSVVKWQCFNWIPKNCIAYVPQEFGAKVVRRVLSLKDSGHITLIDEVWNSQHDFHSGKVPSRDRSRLFEWKSVAFQN